MKILPRLSLLLIAILYLSVTFTISHVAVFNKGPDEETNLAYTEFLINKGRLPVSYEERDLIGKDSNWPALYHLILAQISRLMGIDVSGPPYIKIFWDSFRYRVIDAGQEWYYLYTEDQLWPFLGRILVLHLGRWLSILFGLLNLWLIYRVCLELLPNRPWLGIAAVALAAFWPTYTFISGVMNEDTMMSALTTLYLWVVILAVKEPDKGWLYGAMGLVLGLSVTVKYTTIILPLEVIGVLAVLAWRHAYGGWWWFRRTALVGIWAVVASSWWFGWNFWYLNEVKKLGWLAGLLRPIFTGGPDITLSRLGYFFSGGEIGLAGIPAGREAGTFSSWLQKTFQSFWGESIDGIIPLAPSIFILVALMVGVTGFGLWRLGRVEPPARKWLLLLLFHIGIFLILPLLRFNLTRRIGETAQGRHILLPAFAAVVILVVWGTAVALPPRWRPWGLALFVAGFLTWTGAHLVYLYHFTPTPIPMRTVPQAAAWLSHPLKAQFGEAVELVSYELQPQPDQSLLVVNLAWRSITYTKENFLLKVSLLNSQNQVVAYWMGYHGGGVVPTLAWDPGDTVFDRLSLPIGGLPADTYQVQVQLAGSQGPLVVQPGLDRSDGNGEQIKGDKQLVLAEMVLDQTPPLSFSRHMQLGGPQPGQLDFEVWQIDGPSRSGRPTFRYPATISIVTSHSNLELALVDEAGQVWPASSSEANIYSFVIGPRWQSGTYRLQVSLPESGQSGSQALSEPLLKVENWWQRRFEAPAVETVKKANFANQIMLLGYHLSQSRVKAGESFPITLYWQAPPERSPQASFTQFNHLLDDQGALWGGYDRQPLEYYDTLLWAPGEVVIDGYAVPVQADAPPGHYYLNVGYYLTVGESAVNLPLVIEGQMSEVTSVTIGPIEVVRP